MHRLAAVHQFYRLTISASLQLKYIYHRVGTSVRPIFRATLLQMSPFMIGSPVYHSRKRRRWWAGKRINMVHADWCSTTALCNTLLTSRRSPLEPVIGRHLGGYRPHSRAAMCGRARKAIKCSPECPESELQWLRNEWDLATII